MSAPLILLYIIQNLYLQNLEKLNYILIQISDILEVYIALWSCLKFHDSQHNGFSASDFFATLLELTVPQYILVILSYQELSQQSGSHKERQDENK
jgi:hypothetical protein